MIAILCFFAIITLLIALITVKTVRNRRAEFLKKRNQMINEISYLTEKVSVQKQKENIVNSLKIKSAKNNTKLLDKFFILNKLLFEEIHKNNVQKSFDNKKTQNEKGID